MEIDLSAISKEPVTVRARDGKTVYKAQPELTAEEAMTLMQWQGSPVALMDYCIKITARCLGENHPEMTEAAVRTAFHLEEVGAMISGFLGQSGLHLFGPAQTPPTPKPRQRKPKAARR